jgi:hypothetical protein
VSAADALPTRSDLAPGTVVALIARVRSHACDCGCAECLAYGAGYAACEDDRDRERLERLAAYVPVEDPRDIALAAERARVATLVQALRRVRDEAEYARDQRHAAHMADKHVSRALYAIGEPNIDGHSGAYVCRYEAHPTVRVYEDAIKEALATFAEILPFDPDVDDPQGMSESLDELRATLTQALGHESGCPRGPDHG